MQEQLFGVHEEERIDRKLTLKLMKLILDSQLRLADADSLYTATQLLLSGHLPHFFSFLDDMATAMNEVKNHLLAITDPHMRLIREDFAFYYHTADFWAFLVKNETNQTHLILLLDCPVTLDVLNYYYSVYKLVRFPLPTLESDSFYSLLSTDIGFLGFHVNSDQILQFSGDQLPSGEVWLLYETSLILVNKINPPVPQQFWTVIWIKLKPCTIMGFTEFHIPGVPTISKKHFI